MQFASFTFLFLFLPLTLGLYHLTPYKWKREVLLGISTLFLFCGGWLAAPVVLILSTVTFFSGLLLEKLQQKKALSGALLTGLVLAFFAVLLLLRSDQVQSWNGGWLTGRDVFPVGLSFFVLQCLGYLVDVRRSKCDAEKNWRQLGLYLLFFPKMSMGPIVPYKVALKTRCGNGSLAQVGKGMCRFIIGLSKKLLLAGWIGMLFQTVQQSDLSGYSLFTIWFAAFAQLLSLYLELSGYADMAIGLALCFGVHLPESYGNTLFFPSITAFADQWNRTVVQWFSHYVGTHFHGKNRLFHLFAVVITWSCIGLWYSFHIPAIGFGVVIGICIWLEYLLGNHIHSQSLRCIVTAFLLAIGAVFLTQSDWAEAWAYLQALFGGTHLTPGEADWSLLRSFGVIFVVSLYVASGNWKHMIQKIASKSWFRVVRIPLSMAAILLLLAASTAVLISMGGTAQMMLLL